MCEVRSASGWSVIAGQRKRALAAAQRHYSQAALLGRLWLAGLVGRPQAEEQAELKAFGCSWQGGRVAPQFRAERLFAKPRFSAAVRR